MLQLIGGFLEKFGATGTGLIILAAGIGELLPEIGLSERLAHGMVWGGVGLAIIVFGRKWKSTDDRYVSSEAEKRISNPSLPSSSVVPSIQREITKLKDHNP